MATKVSIERNTEKGTGYVVVINHDESQPFATDFPGWVEAANAAENRGFEVTNICEAWPHDTEE